MAEKVPVENESISEERAAALLDVIMSYARLDFSKRAEISDDDSLFDAVSAGVNMLGEELNSSVVSLKEKEGLLQEIHHRVKNNMQIISSMMRLHCSMTDDPRVEEMVNECQSRISAMSLIHEMLYSTKDFKSTNLSKYVYRLTENIKQSYSGSGSKVKIDRDIDDSVVFDIDRLIPLGLILNEVITNSFKHAFESDEGMIYVRSQKTDDGLLIEMGDNGRGLKDDDDVDRETMGMQLIKMLAEQLGSTVHQKSNSGLHYRLLIPND